MQEGLKKPVAAANASNLVVEPPADVDVQHQTEVEVAQTASADEALQPDTQNEPGLPVDPVAARRATELAELRAIEADEEHRRAEESKKHVKARLPRRTASEEAASQFTNVPVVEVQNRRHRETDEANVRRVSSRREAVAVASQAR